MKLTSGELEFLSAWAREEWEPACYQLHAHQLQLAHGVSGASFITFIKAWTRTENKKDCDVLEVSDNPTPAWPWISDEAFQSRLLEAGTDHFYRSAQAS